MPKKSAKKVVKKSSAHKSFFQKHPHTIWLLPLFFVVAVGYFLFLMKRDYYEIANSYMTKDTTIGDWKTYTNKETKFSLKYPKEYGYKEVNSQYLNYDMEAYVAFSKVYADPKVVNGTSLETPAGDPVLVVRTTTYKSLNAFKDAGEIKNARSVNKIMIGSVEALKVTTDTPYADEKMTKVVYYMIHDGMLYEYSFGPVVSPEIPEKIITTFTLVD